MKTAASPRKLACARCGATFDCSLEGGCWCAAEPYRMPLSAEAAAEDCLAELRDCPPAPGFDRVEVPGEREAALRLERLTAGIPIPPATLASRRALGVRLGVDAEELVAMA